MLEFASDVECAPFSFHYTAFFGSCVFNVTNVISHCANITVSSMWIFFKSETSFLCNEFWKKKLSKVQVTFQIVYTTV